MVLVQHGTHDGERAKFSALFQSTLNGMALSKRISTTGVFPTEVASFLSTNGLFTMECIPVVAS